MVAREARFQFLTYEHPLAHRAAEATGVEQHLYTMPVIAVWWIRDARGIDFDGIHAITIGGVP